MCGQVGMIGVSCGAWQLRVEVYVMLGETVLKRGDLALGMDHDRPPPKVLSPCEAVQ